MKSISRWQLRSREAWWEGSLRQSREAMYKNVILGLASGASEHHVAKPFGLGRRVDGALARWKLVSLSGETSLSCVWPCASRSRAGDGIGGFGGVSRGHSSEMKRDGSSCRRIIRPAKVSGWLTSREGLNRNDNSESSCSSCGYSPTGEAHDGAKGIARKREGLRRLARLALHYSTTVR